VIEMKLNFPMDKCPYCGSEDFIRKVKIFGYGFEVYESNGVFKEENSALHDSLRYKQNKRFYCFDCEKYLFTIN
jgi:hypothetical protein